MQFFDLTSRHMQCKLWQYLKGREEIQMYLFWKLSSKGDCFVIFPLVIALPQLFRSALRAGGSYMFQTLKKLAFFSPKELQFSYPILVIKLFFFSFICVCLCIQINMHTLKKKKTHKIKLPLNRVKHLYP